MHESHFPESMPVAIAEFLQSPRPTRWVASRKVAVVVAVRSGLLSTSEACERYLLSADELARWKAAFETEGRTGLHMKRMIERQHTAAALPHHGLLRPERAAERRPTASSASLPDISDLTPKECAILKCLIENQRAVVSKESLFVYLYNGHIGPEKKTIDVLVCKLRQKLAKIMHGDRCIETVWGRGYMLDDASVARLVPVLKAQACSGQNCRIK
jgi:hypothetical protein